jgi:hypothetical protein
MFFPHCVDTYICGCIPWSSAPQSHEFIVDVNLQTNEIHSICVDGVMVSGNNVETFESHPVLYYLEGTFSTAPQSQCCNCYGHDQRGYLFKPTFFYRI